MACLPYASYCVASYAYCLCVASYALRRMRCVSLRRCVVLRFISLVRCVAMLLVRFGLYCVAFCIALRFVLR